MAHTDLMAFKRIANVIRGIVISSAVISTGCSFIFLPDTWWAILVVNIVTCGILFYITGLAHSILDADGGDDSLGVIADAICSGAEGFMRTQFTAIAKVGAVVGVLLFLVYSMRGSGLGVSPEQQAAQPSLTSSGGIAVASITLFAFCCGAVLSGCAGLTGLWLSIRINRRVAAAAARLSYADSFYLALRGGLVCGVAVVGMCVLGLSFLLTTFFPVATSLGIIASNSQAISHMPHLLVGFGFGASLVALFAQLGGGIYTKAADVGADMVGKVESTIPEDDPRNPAVIADLVGDNVGDCAGRGADLFESIAGEMLGVMILGGALAHKAGIDTPVALMVFPLVLHSFDLALSTAAVMLARCRQLGPSKPPARGSVQGPPPIPGCGEDNEDRMATTGDEEAGQHSEAFLCNNMEDPLVTLERGYLYALSMAVVVMIALSRLLLSSNKAPDMWWHYCLCGVLGIVTSYVFVLCTKYYTDFRYRPVQTIAAASKTGHGTNVIAGIAVGMESSALPTVCCGITLISSYWLGQTSGLTDVHTNLPVGGIFGTAIATMGMLSTAVYVLAMDTFGPITDNAGGIVEMSGQSHAARVITDRLDAIGNVTKATTKGYSIGAAALAAFLLLRAFLDVAEQITGEKVNVVDIAIPEVFVAGLFGGALIFLFAGWSIAAVGRAAGEVVIEVRAQFEQRPGIMNFTEKPDYSRCVSIVTSAALREMMKPGLLAVFSPIVVGVSFRIIGTWTSQPLLGVQAVAGMLLFTTATGILMALFLNNAGGAFDNAKKYIETGMHGGKKSFAHQAAVTGDTLGDPLKDTAGPSIHVLIKLVSTIALVACPVFVAGA